MPTNSATGNSAVGAAMSLVPPQYTDDAFENHLVHYSLTTYAIWIGILAAAMHITLPRPSAVITDAAFALTFGVLVTGTGIVCDWGNKMHKVYNVFNLITHVLPFVLVLAALKGRQLPPAPLWKTIVAACLPPLMYDFACGHRANAMYKRFSPTSDTTFTIPILATTTICGALMRGLV